MSRNLLDYLRRLPPSGSNGFEGLIAKQLENLTDRRFFLSQSGSQSGRDMKSDRQQGNVMAAECKRYGDKRKFDLTELQGKLAQAEIDGPDLDLWILAATRAIPDQIISKLSLQGDKQGIEIRTISSDDGDPSSIELLCAYGSETTLSALTEHLKQKEIAILRRELNAIGVRPGFQKSLQRLKKEFGTEEIGYGNWRGRQNEWFIERLRSESESRAAFLQLLNIEENEENLVERRSVWNDLDKWLSDWSKNKKPLVLHGEEGDGKTWAIASWLSKCIKARPEFPPVIFLSSKKADFDQPLTLLSRAVARQLGESRDGYWAKKFRRWMKKSVDQSPVVLLVLDGINECRTPDWWRACIEALAAEPWSDRVAVLITCRTSYWTQYPFPHRDYEARALPPFEDKELDQALAQRGLSSSDFSPELLTLVRKPRYLDMVVKHRLRMEECGDVTVPRLLYEDWRDRLQRKTQRPLDDASFQGLIKDLAARKLSGIRTIRYEELKGLLPHFAAQAEMVEELCSGGILKRVENKYKIDEHLLLLGFGLLLANEVAIAAESNNAPLDEVIAAWMEPQREMDIKANICEFAAIHGLSHEGFPEKCRLALLKAWLECHNPTSSTEHAFSSLMPLGPQSYVELAEAIWSSHQNDPWAEELMMRTFLRWRDTPKVASIFRGTFELWMGFVHTDGYFFQRGPAGRDIEKTRRDLAERVGHDISPGDVEEIAGCRLAYIDNDGLLRLRLFPLAIISHLARAPYIRAFATACLAEAVMGEPQNEKLFKWVLRSSSDSIGEELRKEAQRFLGHNHLQAKRAAYLLLSYEGSSESLIMRRDLPKNLFPSSWARELHEKDPCTSFFGWRHEECMKCLSRSDLKPEWIARQMQSHCLDPDLLVPGDLGERLAPLARRIDISRTWSSLGCTAEDHFLKEVEPSLCAYSPSTFTNLICQIIRTARDRRGMLLRQLSFQLDECSLIFGSEELSSLHEAWLQLHAKNGDWTEPEEVAEFNLFPYVLELRDPKEQLLLILSRPVKARDLVHFRRKFLPTTDWDFVRTNIAYCKDPLLMGRIIWFLAANPKSIPPEMLTQIASLADSDAALVRTLALEIVFKAGAEECGRLIVEGKWAWDPKRDRIENHWGSLILCEKGSTLPYSEIRSRVHPAYLGLAVEKRGLRAEEVRQYALDIHRIWQSLGSTCADLPQDFPEVEVDYNTQANGSSFPVFRLPRSHFSRSVTFASRDSFWGGDLALNKASLAELLKPTSKEELDGLRNIAAQAFKEQARAGNAWFTEGLRNDKAIHAVVVQYQDLLADWLGPALRGGMEGERLLSLGQGFYEGLCRVLFEQNNPAALALNKRLRQTLGLIRRQDPKTQIAHLDYDMFLGPQTAEAKSRWQERLRECKTDRELFEVNMASRLYQGESWILSEIEEGLRSDLPLNRARSLALAGLVDSERAHDFLKPHSKPEPEAWLDLVAAKALARHCKNRWAKYWYRELISNKDEAKAWAAFRLFLCCVDSRFWQWQDSVDSEVPFNSLRGQRLKYVEDNFDAIAKRILENEKDYRETFLNSKVMTHEANPWM